MFCCYKSNSHRFFDDNLCRLFTTRSHHKISLLIYIYTLHKTLFSSNSSLMSFIHPSLKNVFLFIRSPLGFETLFFSSFLLINNIMLTRSYLFYYSISRFCFLFIFSGWFSVHLFHFLLFLPLAANYTFTALFLWILFVLSALKVKYSNILYNIMKSAIVSVSIGAVNIHLLFLANFIRSSTKDFDRESSRKVIMKPVKNQMSWSIPKHYQVLSNL